MYYDFNFNKDADFFKNSQTVKEITEKLYESKEYFMHIDIKIINASLQLWFESVLKHNLNINMTRIDTIHLISEENSKKVLTVFKKIMMKSKHERTQEEFKVLRDQDFIQHYINLVVLRDDKDYFENLKSEFVEFKRNQLSSENLKNNKIKV